MLHRSRLANGYFQPGSLLGNYTIEGSDEEKEIFLRGIRNRELVEEDSNIHPLSTCVFVSDSGFIAHIKIGVVDGQW